MVTQTYVLSEMKALASTHKQSFINCSGQSCFRKKKKSMKITFSEKFNSSTFVSFKLIYAVFALKFENYSEVKAQKETTA